MIVVYAESSAVLRWLLGGDQAAEVQAAVAGAEAVATSALTSAEVTRALRRLVIDGAVDAGAHDRAWARYLSALARWHVYAITESVLTRASQPFPVEPVWTLHAIHLATVMSFSRDVAPAVVLSVDRRIRENAQALGLGVTPTTV